MRSRERSLALAIAGARVAIGAGALLFTEPALRLLGFRSGDGSLRSLARLAGGRDLALGVLALAARNEPSALRATALAGAGVDAVDAATFGLALARREGIDRAALMGVASAAGATAAGLWAAARLR